MSRTVVVTDYTFPDVASEERAAREAGAAFAAHQCKTGADVAEAVAGADVVAVQFAPFGEKAAKAVAPGATVIRYGVGYDNIDLAAAKAAGLKVGYVPDYCADEVADTRAGWVDAAQVDFGNRGDGAIDARDAGRERRELSARPA